jgi:hypothetical protein
MNSLKDSLNKIYYNNIELSLIEDIEEKLLPEMLIIRNNVFKIPENEVFDFQNNQKLQLIVDNFSRNLVDNNIIDLGVSGENFKKTKIKIKIKELSNQLEIEYPNWLLFCNLKKNGDSKISDIVLNFFN